MIKLRCVVERITYQNPDNGYSVMKVNVKGYNNLITLVGNLLEVPVGSVLLCDGNWKVDKKYESQFVAESWEEVMPATIYGIEKYLGSGLVKGIGLKFAKLIVAKFGLETIDVIESDIERLHEVPGIDKVKDKSMDPSLFLPPLIPFLIKFASINRYLINVQKLSGVITSKEEAGYVCANILGAETFFIGFHLNSKVFSTPS